MIQECNKVKARQFSTFTTVHSTVIVHNLSETYNSAVGNFLAVFMPSFQTHNFLAMKLLLGYFKLLFQLWLYQFIRS